MASEGPTPPSDLHASKENEVFIDLEGQVTAAPNAGSQQNVVREVQQVREQRKDKRAEKDSSLLLENYNVYKSSESDKLKWENYKCPYLPCNGKLSSDGTYKDGHPRARCKLCTRLFEAADDSWRKPLRDLMKAPEVQKLQTGETSTKDDEEKLASVHEELKALTKSVNTLSDRMASQQDAFLKLQVCFTQLHSMVFAKLEKLDKLDEIHTFVMKQDGGHSV